MSKLPNIVDIYRTGMQVKQTDHADGERTKLGNLRVGNSAILTEEGQILGKCARKTYLRLVGIPSEDISFDRLLMFEMGFASEDIWYDKLSKGWDGSILREEEIPIEWMTSNGTKVTGRPDMVLLDSEGGSPVCVLEMKNMSSLWTARSVVFEGVPKFDHLVQAAHYSWKLGIPAKICYSLYLDMAVTGGWATKLFPSKGAPGSELCDYSDDSKAGKLGAIKKVKPSIIVYDLSWTPGGQLLYRNESSPSSRWNPTPITIAGIERYYEMVSKMESTDSTLPPRPISVKGNGEQESWSICNYCPLSSTCDSHEKGSLVDWMEAVKNTNLSEK